MIREFELTNIDENQIHIVRYPIDGKILCCYQNDMMDVYLCVDCGPKNDNVNHKICIHNIGSRTGQYLGNSEYVCSFNYYRYGYDMKHLYYLGFDF